MNKSNQNAFGMLSYIALVIFALSFILARLGANLEYLNWFASGLLLIVVLGNAWEYAHRQLSAFWLIMFYVIAIFTISVYIWGIF